MMYLTPETGRIILLLSLVTSLLFGQSPVVTSFVDADSGSTTLCPGDIAVINGSNLSPAKSVTIGSQNLCVLIPPPFGDGRQIFVQMPVNAPFGATTVNRSRAGRRFARLPGAGGNSRRKYGE